MAQGLWIRMNKVWLLLVRSKLVTTLVPAVPPNEDGSGGSKETTTTTSQTLTEEEFTKLEEKVDEWEENNAKALALGARGYLPGGHIEDTLRFLKQFVHTLPRGYMLDSFEMYPPL